MEPNGSPRWENIGFIVFLFGLAVAYFYSQAGSSEEINYMDFINQYLTKNQVKMITISEDRTSEMFKYRADVETHEGKRVHLVLP